MSKQQRWSYLDTSVERSFVWSLALTVLPVLSAFAISWWIARFAGPEVFGAVSWLMALATAILIIGKFGVEMGASRLASEYGKQSPSWLRPLLYRSLLLRLAFTLPCAVATWVFAPWIAATFDKATLVEGVRVAALVIVGASLFEFYEHYLIGLNRHLTVSKIRAVTLGLRVAVTIYVISLGWGADRVLAGYCAAWAVGITLLAVLTQLRLPASDGSDAPMSRRLMGLAAPLAISSASVTIYSQMDKLMLGYFDTVYEVGQYAAARAITEVSLFPVFAMVMTMRPALASRWSAGEVGNCGAILRQALRVSLVFGVMFASLFFIFAGPMLTTIFSDAFAYAGDLMRVFVWVIALRSLGAMVLPALVAAEKTRQYAFLTTLSAVLNFLLNLWLIPRYQATGAVWATVISYGVLLVLGLAQVFSTFRIRLSARAVSLAARTLFAGIGAATLLWLAGKYLIGNGNGVDATVFVWAGVHVAVYLGLVMALRVIKPADIRAAVANVLPQKA